MSEGMLILVLLDVVASHEPRSVGQAADDDDDDESYSNSSKLIGIVCCRHHELLALARHTESYTSNTAQHRPLSSVSLRLLSS